MERRMERRMEHELWTLEGLLNLRPARAATPPRRRVRAPCQSESESEFRTRTFGTQTRTRTRISQGARAPNLKFPVE